jgi:xylulokinase
MDAQTDGTPGKEADMHLIAIDIGTTGCKSIVFDTTGRILGASYAEYPLLALADGVVEQDASLWWELSVQTVRDALAASGADRSGSFAIGISSQGISFVPVDASCEPIANAISWLDSRAQAEAEEIREAISDDLLYEISGKRLSPAYVLPKILWLRRHRPDLHARTHRYLLAHDFVLARLTGRTFTDPTMACGTLLYDLRTGTWCEPFLARFGIDRGLLPEIRSAGEAAGHLTASAAARLGLPVGTVVAVGGQDQKVAAYGAGLASGDVTLSLGTAGALEFLSEDGVRNDRRAFSRNPYLFGKAQLFEGVVPTAGASLKWVRNTFFADASYADLDRMGETSPPGAGGTRFFPHLAGSATPVCDDMARGALQGISLATSKADVVRSVLEGITYQVRRNLDAAADMGLSLRRMKVFGGGAHSALWCRIIADVAGLPVSVLESVEVACTGAAMLAYRAACGSSEVPFSASTPGLVTHEPDPERVRRYDALYREYRTLEDRIVFQDRTGGA